MNPYSRISTVAQWLHHHFLLFLVISYCLAAVLPSAGLLIRSHGIGPIDFAGASISISYSMLLLSCLLFNAGLVIRGSDLARSFCHPKILLVGILANILYPLLLVASVAMGLLLWHNSSETQTILAGLAIVAAIPGR